MEELREVLLDSVVVTTFSFYFRTFVYLITASLSFWIFWKLAHKKFDRFKVNKNDPSRKQIFAEFFGSLRTLLIWGLMTAPAFFLLSNGLAANKSGPMSDPWYVHLGWFVVLIVVHDAYFYWMHRLMHHPKLYKRFHAYHHKSTSPTPWAIFSFDAGEAIIHFSIGYVFLLVVPCHVYVAVAWFAMMVTYNIIGHLGYELFPNWFARNSVTGISNTTTHHAIHHKYFNCHYGLYFTYWDRLMGTERPDYVEMHEQVRNGQRI